MPRFVTSFLVVALVTSCATNATRAPAPAPDDGNTAAVVENTAPAETAPRPRPYEGTASRYRGEAIGVEYAMHPDMSNLTLPDGMTRLWSLNHADGWHLVVARRGEDLVVLLTDGDGVVTDDVAVAGAAPDHIVMHNCGDDVVPSLVSAGACSDHAGAVTAQRAWRPRDGRLVDVEDEIQCLCDPF